MTAQRSPSLGAGRAIAVNNVFKSCDHRGVNILRDLELKITPPDQVNDVFEFSPHIVCPAPRKMAKDATRDKRLCVNPVQCHDLS